jgi:hypothetical protein
VTSVSTLANWATRVIYSTVAAWLLLLAAIAMAALGIWEWILERPGNLGAIGAEISAALLLALISFLLKRVRANRR